MKCRLEYATGGDKRGEGGHEISSHPPPETEHSSIFANRAISEEALTLTTCDHLSFPFLQSLMNLRPEESNLTKRKVTASLGTWPS